MQSVCHDQMNCSFICIIICSSTRSTNMSLQPGLQELHDWHAHGHCGSAGVRWWRRLQAIQRLGYRTWQCCPRYRRSIVGSWRRFTNKHDQTWVLVYSLSCKGSSEIMQIPLTDCFKILPEYFWNTPESRTRLLHCASLTTACLAQGCIGAWAESRAG